jgi:hypothetical protein
MGFGRVDIIVQSYALNTHEVRVDKTGFGVFPFIIDL